MSNIRHPFSHIPHYKHQFYSFLHQSLSDRYVDTFFAFLGEYQDDEKIGIVGKLGLLDFLLLGIPLLRLPLSRLSNRYDNKVCKIIPPIFNFFSFVVKFVLAIAITLALSPVIITFHFVIRKLNKVEDFKNYDDFELKKEEPKKPELEEISKSPVLPNWFHELSGVGGYLGDSKKIPRST